MTSIELADVDHAKIRRMSEVRRDSKTLKERKIDFDEIDDTVEDEEGQKSRTIDAEQEKSEALATGPPNPNIRLKLTAWMTINTLATIGIVSGNTKSLSAAWLLIPEL